MIHSDEWNKKRCGGYGRRHGRGLNIDFTHRS